MAVDDCLCQADYGEQAERKLEVISATALHDAVSDPLVGSVPSLVAEWNSAEVRADTLAVALTYISCGQLKQRMGMHEDK